MGICRNLGRYTTIFALILLLNPSVWAKDITLAWDHDGLNCTEFRIYRGFSIDHSWPELRGTVPCTQTQFTDTNIPFGDLRWVVTSYYNEIESQASNEERYAYYYPKAKYEYDAQGHVLYKGENANYGAVETDNTWVITKYYYDVKWNVIEIRVRTTSWTNRSSGW
jgi:hypothetical protein